MRTYNIQQGSSEWLQLRATAFTASEAPAMMGCSPYMTRTELLRLKHVGIAQETTSAEQYLFDKGHATEAQFRPVAERIIGQDLYPVTGSIELDGMLLLASFDGLTVDDAHGYEHKLLSQSNLDAITQTGEPPIYHCWQMEQQLLVSGADDILFCTSDGTEENAATCLYYISKPERRAALIAGWRQFAADLAAYVPGAAEPVKPTGKAPSTLPALRIEVTGMVTASNLAEFKETALTAIRGVNRELTTDQDFADAEQSVKWCEDVESRLKAAKEHALSQTVSIDQLFKTIDDISAEARRVRLDLDKLVKSRKEEIRQEITVNAHRVLADHLSALNTRLGKQYMPAVQADFNGAIKGKRNLSSIKDAVDTELARAKIAANEIADRIDMNLKHLREHAKDFTFLFADTATIVLKAPDDLQALVANRINEHKAAEEKRLAAERERIRAEEAARLEREQAEAAARAEREQREALERAQREAEAQTAVTAAQATTAAEAPAPAAAPAPVAANVVPMTRPVATSTASTKKLRLGEICELLGFNVTADFLGRLGFQPVEVERAAKLYKATDLPLICQKLIEHLTTIGQRAAA